MDEKEVDKLEAAMLQLVQAEQKDKNDADHSYCLSLVPVLQCMTPHQKNLLHLSIEQAILEIEHPVHPTYHNMPGPTQVHCCMNAHPMPMPHNPSTVGVSGGGEGNASVKAFTPLQPVSFEGLQY